MNVTVGFHPPATDDLLKLREAFRERGRDLRFVGGCVRDLVLGFRPKDIDLCTDATPEEQMQIYGNAGIAFIPTGLQHGTLTVVLGSKVYEITTLRIDKETDGRHATVEFTDNWTDDLARRDLTINAMAMDMDGRLYDPFGGLDDLRNHRVRFVGDAAARVREDYLRILRWVRFHGRFGGPEPDVEAFRACQADAGGLKHISRERIWSEIRQIATNRRAGELFRLLASIGVNVPTGLPFGSHQEVARIAAKTDDPVTVMVAYLCSLSQVRQLALDWKWSNQERNKAVFLAEQYPRYDVDLKRLLAADGVPLDYVLDLARLQDRDSAIEELSSWQVPQFPVGGRDLVGIGFAPGPMIGEMLTFLKNIWVRSGYTARRDDLLSSLQQFPTQQ